ncbi:unnamed protein product [Durusdinium trenchii]|uniref:ADP-ribosylglycohydrolase n=1 Tax=Durusdinium trenchii TaxID=1381693 RepID=A0ABP0RPY4_9DINO
MWPFSLFGASKSRERRGGEKSRPGSLMGEQPWWVSRRTGSGLEKVSLAEILLRLERLEATCLTSADSWTGESLCERSVLQPALQALESDAGCWRLLAAQAEKDPGCGSAISALLGLAIGDSVGGPLEFLPVTESFDEWDTNRPCVLQGGRDADGRLLYRHAYNRFQLKPGQWTDDTSMALCLADSLLVKTGYDGGDLRLRWHMWWFHGYCNAFRYDERRHGRSSVGLGGNVAKSLADVERHALRGGPVPEIYGSVANDAGNGSIMRLSPVPIAYHSHVDEAMRIAILQSRASHPSCDAAACCAFMAFFIVKAIAMHKSGGSPSADVRGFVGRAVEGFLASGFEEMKEWQDMEGCGRAEGAFRVRALLGSAPPSLKESNWDWKSPAPKIQQAITERLKGRRYNGHPIIDTYWGAYCMDGLAMALWALWHSKSFSESIMKAVNLLGDADTIGAICGQLAGALYGWRGLAGDSWGRMRLTELQRWDPFGEVGLRAALLYHHGPLRVLQVELRQKEGHPAVRVFDQPNDSAGRQTVGEIPSRSSAWQLMREGDFAQVVAEDAAGRCVEGWVGIKNVVRVTSVGTTAQPSNMDEGASFTAQEDPPSHSCPAYPTRTRRPPDSSMGRGSSRRSLTTPPVSRRVGI